MTKVRLQDQGSPSALRDVDKPVGSEFGTDLLGSNGENIFAIVFEKDVMVFANRSIRGHGM